MRQVQVTGFDMAKIQLTDAEQVSPGAGEVLVRVHAASINFRDFMIAQGIYNPSLELPLVPLSDGAGEVVEVGDGVSSVRGGDRVTSLFWQNWPDGVATVANRSVSTGCEAPGMLSEYQLLPEGAVAGFPDSLSYEEAATLPCAALTAWSSLTTHCGTKAGDTVLLLGTGGVSLFGLQFAKALGANVIITSSSDEKLERAREVGADHTINYKENPDWGATAFELGAVGADAIIETGGAGTLPQSLNAVALSGHIAYVGALSGIDAQINMLNIVGKNAHIHGITVGSREDHEKMTGFIAEHGIKPVIDHRFDLEQGPQAIPAITAGKHFGKIVVNLA